jgi:excisionase family DNA binding protein
MARTNKTSGRSSPRELDTAARTRDGAPGVRAGGAAVLLDEPLLDCQAAAALLNVRISWVRDAARLGHLPCLRVGRHLRFTRMMLEDWLAEQVAVSSTPDRTYPRPAAGSDGRSSSRGRFKQSTQAALLVSLAEKPRNSQVDDER